MNKLVELLKQPNWEMTVNQGNLETQITKEDNYRQTITTHDITLVYDMAEFRQDPAAYIRRELKSHQDYLKLIQGDLHAEYRNLHEQLGKESSIERALQFIPEDANRFVIEFVKLVLAPTVWITCRTLKSLLRDVAENHTEILGYMLIGDSVNYGRSLIEGMAAVDGVDGATKRLIEVSDDLKLAYSRLLGTAKKKQQSAQRFYELLYPNEAPALKETT